MSDSESDNEDFIPEKKGRSLSPARRSYAETKYGKEKVKALISDPTLSSSSSSSSSEEEEASASEESAEEVGSELSNDESFKKSGSESSSESEEEPPKSKKAATKVPAKAVKTTTKRGCGCSS